MSNMGFKTVFKCLQEVFPGVDARALRAVAIEHQKDPDAAVEVVLNEVIPYLVERSKPSRSSSESNNMVKCSTDDALLEESGGLVDEQSISSSSKNVDDHDLNDQHQAVHNADCGQHQAREDGRTFELAPTEGTNDGVEEPREGSESVESLANGTSPESSFAVVSSQVSDISSCDLKLGDVVADVSINNIELVSVEAFNGYSAEEHMVTITKHSSQEKSSTEDDDQLEVVNSGVPLSVSNVQFVAQSSPESSLSLVVVPDMVGPEIEPPELEGPRDNVLLGEPSVEMVDIGSISSASLNSVVARSGKVCSIDLLGDIIADARNNKKTLFLAMESVIYLMKEVELQEKAAEQAIKEASIGGLETLNRVEELKKMLHHAKEANDMHAGEVYGEKAILATEVKELQSRLLSLADERDKSLGVLDEMRQTLEIRLTEAKSRKRSAEQEKLEKEDLAHKALADQELIMEKVVQESKILKEQAEENAELREFLVDRGRVVDCLQGEISVICQDVRLLKEKFDDRVPLSESLSSSGTSCIIASASSSFKSMAADLVDQVIDPADSVEALKKTELSACSNEKDVHEKGAATNDVTFDDWELDM